jgi:hypothetical protein
MQRGRGGIGDSGEEKRIYLGEKVSKGHPQQGEILPLASERRRKGFTANTHHLVLISIQYLSHSARAFLMH